MQNPSGTPIKGSTVPVVQRQDTRLSTWRSGCKTRQGHRITYRSEGRHLLTMLRFIRGARSPRRPVTAKITGSNPVWTATSNIDMCFRRRSVSSYRRCRRLAGLRPAGAHGDKFGRSSPGLFDLRLAVSISHHGFIRLYGQKGKKMTWHQPQQHQDHDEVTPWSGHYY